MNEIVYFRYQTEKERGINLLFVLPVEGCRYGKNEYYGHCRAAFDG